MQMRLQTAIKRAVAGYNVPDPMLTLVENVLHGYLDWPKSKATRRRRKRNRIARKSRRKNRKGRQ